MEQDPRNADQQGGQQQAQTSQENPHNPFKEDAPIKEATPEEEAALEQQRKEALTERD